MTEIKICGLTRKEDIIAANQYLPDYVGFVFAKSRRQVTEEQAAALKAGLRKEITAVGVFVNQDRDWIAHMMEKGFIDMIQLHGGETQEDIRWLRERCHGQIIKAVSVKTEEDILKMQDSEADYLLLDQGEGGSGKTFDWELTGKCRLPFFLAGGIGEHNIEAALFKEPFAVDISGGVETNGVKDAVKIKRIIERVRKSK